MISIRFSAAELARHLGAPQPTAQQAQAIEAPMAPVLIVAGAGSGKTTTMAARVAWLVANRLVRPEQVLGLTFTRKAARELSAEVRRQLQRLRAAGVVEDTWVDATEPTVSTYDAYTARLVGEHGVRLGVEPDRRVVGPSVLWQVAMRVAEAYDGDMTAVSQKLGWAVDTTLDLHGDLAGHGATPAQVEAYLSALRSRALELPRAPRQRADLPGAVKAAYANLLARQALLPMVTELRQQMASARPPMMDYATQASVGAQLACFADVVAAERAVSTVVLLDEYQDTSVSQVNMLERLFGDGHSVTAVGDPCQSIYGWRGASAGALEEFPQQFPDADGTPATVLSLSRSFRNGPRVLAVANAISAPLRQDFAVAELESFDPSRASRVEVNYYATVDDEAVAIAERARALLAGATHPPEPAGSADDAAPSIAVLVRARSQIPRIVTALDAQALPYQVIGIGGLLMTPEVSDVVAVLRVLADPSRGDALMRLLTGSRIRFGASDLHALGRFARRQSPVPAATSGQRIPMDADADAASLIDALECLPAAGVLSVEAHRRAQGLRRDLQKLRSRIAQPLPDLVADVIHTFGLDVETLAARGPGGRANLDRFLDECVGFADGNEAPTLPSFLAWLEAALAEDRGLERGEEEAPPGTAGLVQILTVHTAKGLEWDAVFVLGLLSGTFPSSRGAGNGWLGTAGVLPYELRGDADRLPVFGHALATDHAELLGEVNAFRGAEQTRQELEERRLAYVAFTRARSLLVLSGARWGTGKKPRAASTFLLEMRDLPEVTVSVWAPDDDVDNPLEAVGTAAAWPVANPLGARREYVLAGADLVARAMRNVDVEVTESESAASPWSADVDLLITELDARRRERAPAAVQLPGHVTVSQMVSLARDPDTLASSVRRPMPQRPSRQARRGTAFHTWLEQRWGQAPLLDLDDLPGAADAGHMSAGQDALAELRTAFLQSQWAERTPLLVEPAFELPLGPVVVRGRADAVFRDGSGYVVVDWKTGPPPRDRHDLRVRSVQLALYRVAFAELLEVPVGQVGAVFHHIAENVTVRPVDLLDGDGLRRLLEALPEAASLLNGDVDAQRAVV